MDSDNKQKTFVTGVEPSENSICKRRLLLVGAISALLSTAATVILLNVHPAIAFFVLVFYFMGGITWFTGKTPIREAVAAGVFVGIISGCMIFYWLHA